MVDIMRLKEQRLFEEIEADGYDGPERTVYTSVRPYKYYSSKEINFETSNHPCLTERSH